MGTEGFAAPEQYEGKVNSSSDLYALGKTLQALAGKNWLSVLWKVPGFALFLYKCTRPQGKRRFENAAQARKMLSGIGKRKGLARKNAAVVIGTTGILLAAGVFLAVLFRNVLLSKVRQFWARARLKNSVPPQRILTHSLLYLIWS